MEKEGREIAGGWRYSAKAPVVALGSSEMDLRSFVLDWHNERLRFDGDALGVNRYMFRYRYD